MFKKLVIAAAIVALIPMGLFAQGSLDVNGDASYAGNFGLEVSVNGQGSKAYVEDQTPAAETVYSASFWINPNDQNLETGNAHFIFTAIGPNPDGGAGNVKVLEIESRKRSGNAFRVRAYGYYDNQVNPKRLSTPFLALGRTVWNRLQVEWTQSSSNSSGSVDSIVRLSVVEGPSAGQTGELVGVVKNRRHVIETVRLGAVTGVDATTTGSNYFDDFTSFRTLAP